MSSFLFFLIFFFGIASYVVGVTQIQRGKYKPSVFSRIVWLLLAANGFAGVLLGDGSRASVVLSAIFLTGNALVCLASIFKGTRTFGKTEYVCSALLILSGLVWVFFDAPLINLSVTLVAHFIGGIPTLKRVWVEPSSESTGFWSLFFIASLLSVFASPFTSVSAIVFPLYFTLWDGALTVLSLRKAQKV